jgi:hypothetical protein
MGSRLVFFVESDSAVALPDFFPGDGELRRADRVLSFGLLDRS